jgi:hypothetical protein
MNFERRNNDPLRTLDIGRRSIKKTQMQNLFYKEKFGIHGKIWMGMGLIIELIQETKDDEYLEIFKEDFLKYFLIPLRKGEKLRWKVLYPDFKAHSKAHKLIAEISKAFLNIK